METHTRSNIRLSRRVSLIAIMTALSLVGNYALVVVPNVELGSTILFFTGLLFGIDVALPCVILMALVYGTINPWGGLIPPIWIGQVIGWSYMVIAAHFFRPRNGDVMSVINPLHLAVVGAFVTVIFDLTTNIGYAIAFSVPFVVALITGLPFMLIHGISNMILFSAAIPPLTRAICKHLAEEIWDHGIMPIDGEE